MLIDTHAHVYAQEFEHDYTGVILRAIEAGVGKIFMPNVHLASLEHMLSLQKAFPDVCFPQIGLHPCSVNADYLAQLQHLKAYIPQHTFHAIGEIGLDLYWDKSFYDQQCEAFHTQIEWALAYDLPIVIHSREANNEAINIVKQYQNTSLKGVFHCFSGTAEQAEQMVSLGFYVGIGGVLTFKNSGLDKIVHTIPLTNIVLETDAPYLAPTPYRGKTNEPSYLPLIAQKLAETLALEVEEIIHITTQNALRLYQMAG